MTSRSWIECSISVPPPALSTSRAPCRSVHALDREVLVVAQDQRHRLPVATRLHDLRQVAEHRSVAQDEPDLVRNLFEQLGDPSAVRQRRRERLLAEHRQAPGDRGLDRREMAVRPRADPGDVHLVEQRVEASRPEWPAWFASASRCGPVRVGVVGRGDVGVDQAGVGELAKRERVDRADVAAADEPDSQHQSASSSSVVGPGRSEGPRGPTGWHADRCGVCRARGTPPNRRHRCRIARGRCRRASSSARRSSVAGARAVVEVQAPLHARHRPRAAAPRLRAGGCRRRGRPRGAGSRAVSPISRARSVGVGSVCERVIVRKSP